MLKEKNKGFGKKMLMIIMSIVIIISLSACSNESLLNNVEIEYNGANGFGSIEKFIYKDVKEALDEKLKDIDVDSIKDKDTKEFVLKYNKAKDKDRLISDSINTSIVVKKAKVENVNVIEQKRLSNDDELEIESNFINESIFTNLNIPITKGKKDIKVEGLGVTEPVPLIDANKIKLSEDKKGNLIAFIDEIDDIEGKYDITAKIIDDKKEISFNNGMAEVNVELSIINKPKGIFYVFDNGKLTQDIVIQIPQKELQINPFKDVDFKVVNGMEGLEIKPERREYGKDVVDYKLIEFKNNEAKIEAKLNKGKKKDSVLAKTLTNNKMKMTNTIKIKFDDYHVTDIEQMDDRKVIRFIDKKIEDTIVDEYLDPLQLHYYATLENRDEYATGFTENIRLKDIKNLKAYILKTKFPTETYYHNKIFYTFDVNVLYDDVKNKEYDLKGNYKLALNLNNIKFDKESGKAIVNKDSEIKVIPMESIKDFEKNHIKTNDNLYVIKEYDINSMVKEFDVEYHKEDKLDAHERDNEKEINKEEIKDID